MNKPSENNLEYNHQAEVLLSQLLEKNKDSYPNVIVFDYPSWIKEADDIFLKLNYPDLSEFPIQKRLMSSFMHIEFCREYCEKNWERPFAYHFYSFPVFSKNFDLAYVEFFKRFAPLVGHGENAIYKRESGSKWVKNEVIASIIS